MEQDLTSRCYELLRWYCLWYAVRWCLGWGWQTVRKDPSDLARRLRWDLGRHRRPLGIYGEGYSCCLSSLTAAVLRKLFWHKVLYLPILSTSSSSKPHLLHLVHPTAYTTSTFLVYSVIKSQSQISTSISDYEESGIHLSSTWYVLLSCKFCLNVALNHSKAIL
jgi:hypothetical protein